MTTQANPSIQAMCTGQAVNEIFNCIRHPELRNAVAVHVFDDNKDPDAPLRHYMADLVPLSIMQLSWANRLWLLRFTFVNPESLVGMYPFDHPCAEIKLHELRNGTEFSWHLGKKPFSIDQDHQVLATDGRFMGNLSRGRLV